MMETILVVGASGNIGVSVIIASLRSGYRVLAVVRNKDSAEKVRKNVSTMDGVTLGEANVLSDDGVSGVVEQVKAGKLPAFQHVYSTVGILDMTSPMQNLDMKTFRHVMQTNLEANFLAYRATVPYLLEQGNPNSTWTLITGGAGEAGMFGVTAISQGALFTMANAACRENADTNIRFNEVWLNYRVDYDSVCEEKGTEFRIKASDFAKTYEGILANKNIRGCRVSITGPEDLDKLKFQKKLPEKQDEYIQKASKVLSE